MLAEVAYGVYQALSEEEKARLYVMIDSDRKPTEVKQKKDSVWTVEECTPVLLKFLEDRKKKHLASAPLKVVE